MAQRLIGYEADVFNPFGALASKIVGDVETLVFYDPDTADPSTCCMKPSRNWCTDELGLGYAREGDIDYGKVYTTGTTPPVYFYFLESDDSIIGTCETVLVEAVDPECEPVDPCCDQVDVITTGATGNMSAFNGTHRTDNTLSYGTTFDPSELGVGEFFFSFSRNGDGYWVMSGYLRYGPGELEVEEFHISATSPTECIGDATWSDGGYPGLILTVVCVDDGI